MLLINPSIAYAVEPSACIHMSMNLMTKLNFLFSTTYQLRRHFLTFGTATWDSEMVEEVAARLGATCKYPLQ
jgi:hypothetical protein